MIKIKDLEFRRTKSLHDNPKIYWEIVKWDKMKSQRRFYPFSQEDHQLCLFKGQLERISTL